MEVQQKIISYEKNPVECEVKGCKHPAVRTNKYANLNLCMGHYGVLSDWR